MRATYKKIDVADLIGKPFEIGARGPDKYDCYGLLVEVFKRAGSIVPDYESPSDGKIIAIMMSKEIELWEETHLEPGAALLFRIPGSTHVGVYLGNDKFIHSWQECGVLIERLTNWQQRLIGVYRYVGHGSG